jgi:hypothetical protein
MLDDKFNSLGAHNAIFIGDCSNKSRRSYARLEALKKILPNSNFTEVNWNPGNIFLKFIFKIYLKFSLSFLAPWYLLLHVLFKKNILIWIDNFPIFNQASIKIFKFFKPRIKIIFVSEDNFLLPHNFSKLHLPLLKHYDFIFTTKDFVLKKLDHMDNVFKFHDSFDGRFFNIKFIDTANNIRHSKSQDVTFIGTYEEERFRHLLFLAENNIKIDIFGSDWPENLHQNLIIHPPVYGDSYEEIIKSSRINLIFLRKSNYDTITSRSYEIPYFNTFFLAEHSKEHNALYENQEILFSSCEDLLFKINLWMERPEYILDKTAHTLFKKITSLDRSIFNETKKIIMRVGES